MDDEMEEDERDGEERGMRKREEEARDGRGG